jgi:hypothetical protein
LFAIEDESDLIRWNIFLDLNHMSDFVYCRLRACGERDRFPGKGFDEKRPVILSPVSQHASVDTVSRNGFLEVSEKNTVHKDLTA